MVSSCSSRSIRTSTTSRSSALPVKPARVIAKRSSAADGDHQHAFDSSDIRRCRSTPQTGCRSIATRYTDAAEVRVASNRSKQPYQLELVLPTWGGMRAGAGRKRKCERPSVPHVVRSRICRSNPVLVTMRVRDDIPNLRDGDRWNVIVDVMRANRACGVLATVHYVVLGNHLHLIAEADDRAVLSTGMQALSTRLAKRINACCGRSGAFFAGRYHARELATPREVYNGLRYVLLNARHHAEQVGVVLPPRWIDPRSTAVLFDGWRDPPAPATPAIDLGVVPARSWLLREGWRRHGPLALDDVPGSTRATRLARAA
jgi:REP-associated tyrosine transposase